MTITVTISQPGEIIPIKMEFRREHPDPELDAYTRLVSRTGLTDREARLAEDLGDEINVFLNEIAAGRGADLDRFVCTDGTRPTGGTTPSISIKGWGTPAFTADPHILSPAANEAYSNHLLARYESNANLRAMVDAELIAAATAEIQNARDEAVIAQDEYRKAEGW